MKDQRIQCVKCWYFRRYDNWSMQPEGKGAPIVDEQTERECEA